MTQDIIVTKSDVTPSIDSNLNTVYFETENMRVERVAHYLSVQFLENSFQSGKSATSFSISGTQVVSPITALKVVIGVDTLYPAQLRAYLESLSFEKDRWDTCIPVDIFEGVKVSKMDGESKRSYSPFHLERLKPITELPNSWNLTHVKRALANGQASLLKCNGVYTDDYAGDAAVNYRRGPVEATKLLKKLVHSPSGWWTALDRKTLRVNICCHHFDSNEFVLSFSTDKVTAV